MNFKNIEKAIRTTRKTGAWSKGVTKYALELLEDLREGVRQGYISKDDLCNERMIERALLNGAQDWNTYSWGGCSLIYNQEIAERLCNPSELKITRNGQRKPNKSEEWLDTQARALNQASRIVTKAILENK